MAKNWMAEMSTSPSRGPVRVLDYRFGEFGLDVLAINEIHELTKSSTFVDTDCSQESSHKVKTIQRFCINLMKACLTITWNLTANDSRVGFVNRTVKFQENLYIWRDCVANVTGGDLERDNNSICRYCKHQFNDLFAYYWNIYVEPGINFCVDVETTMNDTVHIWNDVWECAQRKDRKRDTAAVLVTTAVLLSITVIFYASSYIQGGRQARVFIRYSRREPHEQRSSLLTPSASLSNMDVCVYSIRNHR